MNSREWRENPFPELVNCSAQVRHALRRHGFQDLKEIQMASVHTLLNVTSLGAIGLQQLIGDLKTIYIPVSQRVEP